MHHFGQIALYQWPVICQARQFMDDEAIRDMFDGLGPVSIRRMFGGKGIYHRGVIVAIEIDGQVMLKGDERTGPEFERTGAARWVYQGKKRPVAMPYWSIPDSAVDDPDEMALWTRKAYEAALRTRK